MNLNLKAALLAGAVALAAVVVPSKAPAQSALAKTTNSSVVIATGGTFQSPVGLSTVATQAAPRRSLTIQNNNSGTTERCYVYLGASGQTTGKSIALSPGQTYTRYFPYIPSDVVQVTCDSTSSTMYVDFN